MQPVYHTTAGAGRRCRTGRLRSFDGLTQAHINTVLSHINSYSRPALNDKAPFDLFAFTYGVDLLTELGLQRIPADRIVLKPSLRGANHHSRAAQPPPRPPSALSSEILTAPPGALTPPKARLLCPSTQKWVAAIMSRGARLPPPCLGRWRPRPIRVGMSRAAPWGR